MIKHTDQSTQLCRRDFYHRLNCWLQLAAGTVIIYTKRRRSENSPERKSRRGSHALECVDMAGIVADGKINLIYQIVDLSFWSRRGVDENGLRMRPLEGSRALTRTCSRTHACQLGFHDGRLTSAKWSRTWVLGYAERHRCHAAMSGLVDNR